MDLFSILSMIGGLSMFLFGMNTMGDGLVKVSGGKLEKLLEKLTSKRIMAVLTGCMVTAVIQSSSATTVMVVGFVNSGIMKLEQAVGIIMGANIGTTVTSWILSLTGLQGTNIFIQLLKPSSFSPVLAAIGIIMTMSAGENMKKKDIGTILLGFAVLMFGMETMSDAVKPLASDPNFTSILTKFSNPILGMIAGAVLTAVIQSSSASVGILQALCATGAVGFSAAIPIIMGQNIGTCVTALISSIGAKKNAKRAAMMHLYFNLIGTIVFMIVFYSINHFVDFAFMHASANAAGIAIVHSLFNIGCAIVWFPFANLLVKLAKLTIPEGKDETEEKEELPQSLASLDDRFIDKPAFAMQLCRNAAIDMAKYAQESWMLAMDTLSDYSAEKCEKVVKLENLVDHFEDVLGTYMVRLSAQNLSKRDSEDLSVLLHCINDFERISDHAINIVESAQEMQEKKIVLTDNCKAELAVFSRTVGDVLKHTVEVFMYNDVEKAKHIEPLEEVIDTMSMEMKQRHIVRLRNGECSIEAGLILEDIITGYERVSDHCSNVAICLIQISKDEFDMHEYLDVTIKGDNSGFIKEYTKLLGEYALPAK